MEARPKELENYVAENDGEPFEEWLKTLDFKMSGIVDARLVRVRMGNLGDCHSVGEGVSELRIDVGAGYRVYFGQDGDTVVLLWGGIKKTQEKDVKIAKKYWRDYCA